MTLSQQCIISHLILTHLKFSACDCGHNEAGGVTNAQSWDVTCRYNELGVLVSGIANDGGLVRSGRRGGEDDLLNRGGAPLSGQELQD